MGERNLSGKCEKCCEVDYNFWRVSISSRQISSSHWNFKLSDGSLDWTWSIIKWYLFNFFFILAEVYKTSRLYRMKANKEVPTEHYFYILVVIILFSQVYAFFLIPRFSLQSQDGMKNYFRIEKLNFAITVCSLSDFKLTIY